MLKKGALAVLKDEITEQIQNAARGKETKDYSREPEASSPESDELRRLAVAILVQSIRDYHEGKRIARKYKLLPGDDMSAVPSRYREKLIDARKAMAWMDSRLSPGMGWTFNDTCSMLRIDPALTRRVVRLPSVMRALNAVSFA